MILVKNWAITIVFMSFHQIWLVTYLLSVMICLKTESTCKNIFQGFMMDLMAFSVHAIISPCVIFWASSEARKPAVDHCYLAIWHFHNIRSNLIDTTFKRICRKVSVRPKRVNTE